MKQVIQLNNDGYFVGVTVADESPLEPGVYHIPYGCIEAEVPEQREGKLVKWSDGWVYEDIPQETPEEPQELSYVEKRAAEYPDFRDYLDGIVKGDQQQIQAYIDACLAVKAKYPKPE